MSQQDGVAKGPRFDEDQRTLVLQVREKCGLMDDGVSLCSISGSASAALIYQFTWSWSQVALKASDLGSMWSSKELSVQWVARLEREFFRQGDRERQSSLQVSPLMDRRKAGVSKSQTEVQMSSSICALLQFCPFCL